MGRLEDYSERPLMSASQVAKYLLATCPSLDDFESFMFGSSLNGIGYDYDILIVGPGGELLVRLKKELNAAGAELPLDVLYMLPTEAKATGFVSLENCIPLKVLAGACGDAGARS
jgi:hypothetical protein